MSNNQDVYEKYTKPMRYQFRVKGHMAKHWNDWFQSEDITLERNGNTVFSCTVADYAALYGLISKMRDLGLDLLSVKRVDTE